MKRKSKRTVSSKERFYFLIETFKKSDLSQKAFCLEHHVSYSTFQYWLKKFKEETNTESPFIEVAIPAKKYNKYGIEILFPSGAKIIYDAQSDIGLIRALVF